MPILFVLCAVIGAGLVLNLVLTLGVIRRLREQGSAADPGTGPDGRLPTLAVGTTVEPFAVTTVDGETVSRDTLEPATLVGVFSPDCAACAERLPEFVAMAGEFPGGRRRTLALLVGEEDQTASQRAQLASVARVVVELPGDPLFAALGVRAFPTFALLDGAGRILASELVPSRLPVPAGI
jgi:hypothetical protein